MKKKPDPHQPALLPEVPRNSRKFKPRVASLLGLLRRNLEKELNRAE